MWMGIMSVPVSFKYPSYISSSLNALTHLQIAPGGDNLTLIPVFPLKTTMPSHCI